MPRACMHSRLHARAHKHSDIAHWCGMYARTASPPSLPHAPPHTDEMGLLKALRDAVEAQDGDLGLGSSLQSMQGACCWCCEVWGGCRSGSGPCALTFASPASQ